MKRKIAIAAIVAGICILLLAGGRSDHDFGSIFRQAMSGLFISALGVAWIYAEEKVERE